MHLQQARHNSVDKPSLLSRGILFRHMQELWQLLHLDKVCVCVYGGGVQLHGI